MKRMQTNTHRFTFLHCVPGTKNIQILFSAGHATMFVLEAQGCHPLVNAYKFAFEFKRQQYLAKADTFFLAHGR